MLNEKERLFSAVTGYREAMKSAYKEYDRALKTPERQKESIKSAKAHLKETAEACKTEYISELRAIVKDLKDRVVRRSLQVPTNSQRALLEVMAMQPVLFEDILVQAAHDLASSPLALEALRGIAIEKNAGWPIPDFSDTLCTLTGARAICEKLDNHIASFLAYMERFDIEKQSNEFSEQLNILDRDFSTADECFQAFADINETQCKKFFEFWGERNISEIGVR